MARRREHSEDRASAATGLRRGRLAGAVAILALGIAAAVLVQGRSDPSMQPAATSDVRARELGRAELRGVPRQIRANLRDANRVLDASLRDRLASLRGVPVVVNQWASWCPPCRAEFPFFQQLASRHRSKVAFLGVNSRDQRDAAEEFLEQYPVEYPSVFDSDAAQARSLGAGAGWPTTVFLDAAGTVTFIRQGGYASPEALDADIRAHALGGR